MIVVLKMNMNALSRSSSLSSRVPFFLGGGGRGRREGKRKKKKNFFATVKLSSVFYTFPLLFSFFFF